MALADGAEAIAGDLPRSRVTRVEVPLEAGESIETGVQRASSLMRVHSAITDALLTLNEPVVTVGGDCSVSLAAIAHVASDDMAVLWFDAHGDLHSPQSSPSGAFSGMALRSLVGEGPQQLEAVVVPAERVVLVGSRLLDDAEAEYLSDSAISTVSAEASATPESVVDAVAATGARSVYIHVDLDVIDPAEMSGVTDAAPFGVGRAHLVDAIRAVRERFDLVGATIAGFSPASPAAAVDDMGTILRVIGALA